MLNYEKVLLDHKTEMQPNDALISDLRDTIISANRSIKTLTTENNGHNIRIADLNRLIKEMY